MAAARLLRTSQNLVSFLRTSSQPPLSLKQKNLPALSNMFFWPECLRTNKIADLVESMRNAEADLLKFAPNFKLDQQQHTELDIQLQDTRIPRTALPMIEKHGCHVHSAIGGAEDDYIIHGVRITSKDYKQQPDLHSSSPSSTSSSAPLVLLHGYMNGSSYFYRNFAGLSAYFPSVYSLDWLGWGLSSRPINLLGSNPTVEDTENVFCESLEAWRVQNKIDKMVLAGHSMGGYLSVAYCERYPQHVERLVLISPVGVPDTPPPGWAEGRENSSFRTRMFFNTFHLLFNNEYTPGSVLRSLPSSKTRSMVDNYVKNRLPAIADDDERRSVADYLYYNAMLPGSAEYCVNKILTTPYLLAKRPLVHRIPRLQVPSVTFLYGSHDWMDCTGGLKAQLKTEELLSSHTDKNDVVPNIEVYRVDRAGHLLMLDNYQEFNAGVALVNNNHVLSHQNLPMPTKLCPIEDMPSLGIPANHEFSRVQKRVTTSSENREMSQRAEPVVE